MAATADAFSALAPLVRVRPQIQRYCRFGSQWESGHDGERVGWVPFHIVTQGACRLDTAQRCRIELATGDVALLPHGGAHTLYSLPGPLAADGASGVANVAMLRSGVSLRSNTAAKPDTGLLCGRLRLEHIHDNMILTALPAVIVVRAADHKDDAQRVRQLADAIRQEIEADRPGAAAIAADLASALLMIVLRNHLQRSRPGGNLLHARGVFALMGQPRTDKVLRAILAEPGRPWRLEQLAARAGTSRATLVRMFRRTATMSPLAFVAELRLSLARQRLQAAYEPVAAIAASLGYQSESAFSRAYRRRFGMAPGRARASRVSS